MKHINYKMFFSPYIYQTWIAIFLITAITPFASMAAEVPMSATCQPVEGNEMFFGGKAVFNTFHGRPVPLTFIIKRNKKKLKNPALILYLPKQIKLLEAFQASLYNKDVLYHVSSTKVSLNGQTYYRYETTDDITDAISDNYKSIRQACQITVALDAPDTYSGGKIYWALENNGKEFSKKSFTIKFLKPLSIPSVNQSKQFYIMSYRSMMGLAYHDTKLQKDASDLLLASGIMGKGAFRQRASRRGKFDAYLQQRGIKLYMSGFWAGPMDVLFWAKSHPKAMGLPGAMGPDGKRSKQMASPIPILRNTQLRKKYLKYVKDLVKKSGPCDAAVFDYEPWQWATKYGFGPKTLAVFRKRFNISGDLTPKIILNKYREQWTKFWVYLSAQFNKMMAEACRKAAPDMRIVSYTYFRNYGKGAEQWKEFERCPKDPRREAGPIDALMLSAYHRNGKKLVSAVRMSKRYIRDADLSIIASLSRHNIIQKNYTPLPQALSPQQMYQKAILCAAMGIKCFGLWPGRYIDGAFYVSLGKAARLIWAHEKFYYDGHNIHDSVSVTCADSSIGQNTFAYTAQQYTNKRLVSLFNFNDKPLRFIVHMNGTSWTKNCTVPAHGVKLVEAG